MEIDAILKEYKDDKGRIGRHRFKEIKPYVWIETGCATTWIRDSKSVVVDGETYHKDFVRQNCIVPYWAFPLVIDFQKFAIDLETKDVIDLMGLLGKYTYSVAPHFTADVYAYCGWGIQHPPILDEFEPIKEIEKWSFGKKSENHNVNMIKNLCVAYGIETYANDFYGDNEYNGYRIKSWRDKKKPILRFRHLCMSYGFNNAVYCEYSFEELINMDPIIFEKDDLAYLEKECKRNEILKNTLNFKVFERKLTDIEKVSCATDFFKFIINNQKISTSCNPSIQNHF